MDGKKSNPILEVLFDVIGLVYGMQI